ncbi:MAG: hypothetical protein K9J16_00105 [Melioribacteraceae bacterium]|nr:hypothetical protein [Melioribacteraceae bacterium]MCF8353911.1 hypothetical protein [Melioribacteraceae bacterium]MCF8392668.1 hypothetical protein [Melioribacteraceae bacterium]MCF8417689.1 hypothetical protein [Melioribacteraceae bacterium]
MKQTEDYILKNITAIKNKKFENYIYFTTSNLFNNKFVERFILSKIKSQNKSVSIIPSKYLLEKLSEGSQAKYDEIHKSIDPHTLWEMVIDNQSHNIKIFQRILDYINENSAQISFTWKRDFSSLPLKNKIGANFSVHEGAQTVLDMYEKLWPQIMLVDYYIEIYYASDFAKINSLLNQVLDQYKELNHFHEINSPVNYVRHIDMLASNIIPRDITDYAESLACAKALVLYFFELCEFGCKQEGEQLSLFHKRVERK